MLDGGLVETLFLGVGRLGVGRAVIRGVAADGTRSRVIVSPDNGKWSGDSADAAGIVQVGRDAGSNGHLEIRDGGLLRVRDGGGTHGPGFTLARFKGSVATLLIDGAGSSLEVIQNAPATLHPLGDDFVYRGPFIWLGRRGSGTTTVSNGGSLQIKGENAFVGVTRSSVNQFSSEPDTNPVNQRSVVRVESGGRVEIDGKDARMVIGPSGASVDSEVIVTGPGSVLELSGTGNRLVVGDNGGSGRLEAHNGGAVRYGELVVGMYGSTNVTAPEEPPPEEPPPEEPPPEEPPPEEPPPEEPPPEEPPPEEPPPAAAGRAAAGRAAAGRPEEPPPEEPAAGKKFRSRRTRLPMRSSPLRTSLSRKASLCRKTSGPTRKRRTTRKKRTRKTTRARKAPASTRAVRQSRRNSSRARRNGSTVKPR